MLRFLARDLAAFPAIALVVAASGPALAQDLTLESQVPGLAIEAVTELPENPDAATAENPDDWCSNQWREPEGAGAKAVLDRGWFLTGEQAAGDLTLVSFVGKFGQGTSGSCVFENGNIGVFRGDQLAALIYAPAGTGDDASYRVGRAHTLEPAGFRIFNGDYLPMPVADLQVSEQSVTVLPMSERDTLCGDVEVPNLYAVQINEAREKLFDEGWEARPSEEPSTSEWVRELAEGDVPELHDCAGTGFGYCSLEYSNPAGQVLELTTVGEWGEDYSPFIAGYEMRCEGGPA